MLTFLKKGNSLTLLLSLIIIAVFFVSCGDSTENSSLTGNSTTNDTINDEVTPESLGIDGKFDMAPQPTKADGPGRRGLPASTEGYDTQVWDIFNQWTDTNTTNAKKAGIAWDENSGLNWDEKYRKWVEEMQRTPSEDGYYTTFTLTTPFAKTIKAPVLECAEVAIFLRITFASWYGLPFYLESIDSRGKVSFFGHFGWRTKDGNKRYKTSPLYKKWYNDYSHYTAQDIADKGWPSDDKLKTRGLYGEDDLQPFLFTGARAGAYFDEIFLNKRVGRMLLVILSYFGSVNLADANNMYNIKADSIQAGDALVERWQKRGIGHVMVIKHVEDHGDGTMSAEIVSGSMPRRQPKWESEVSSKGYFTLEETGGQGTNYDGDEYAKLGGGVKRWRSPIQKSGYWVNTYLPTDQSKWIASYNTAEIAKRPEQLKTLLKEVDPTEKKLALIEKINQMRDHLKLHPASCSARISREKAFAELYTLMSDSFYQSKEDTDKQVRAYSDYVFPELIYNQSKTCCWNKTTEAMHEIVMEYNVKREQDAGQCLEPVGFMARNGGYDIFKDYADSIGRGSEWVSWSEDESCPQRNTVNDTEAPHSWTQYCSIPGGLSGNTGGNTGGNNPGSGNNTGNCSDTYAGNQTLNTAASITVGNYAQLKICNDEHDWFAVDIQNSGTITVTIDFSNSNADLDLFLLDSNSQNLNASEGYNTQEQLSNQVNSGETVYINVVNYNSSESTQYDLTIELQ